MQTKTHLINPAEFTTMFGKISIELSWWEILSTNSNKLKTKSKDKNESMSIVLKIWELTTKIIECGSRNGLCVI